MLNYYTLGQGEIPILYLHGWGASGQAFYPVMEKLPRFFNVAVDFDGFGASPNPPEQGFTVEDYAENAAEIIRALNLPKAVIVAHSFGCRVSLVLAAKYPELIDRLLLFAPAGIRRFSFKRWCRVRLYKVKKRLGLSNRAASGSADYQATPDALKSTFVKVVNQDLSSYARQIRCKTLIVAGRQDKAVPYREALRLAKLIQNSDLAQICGDHFQLFYTPDTFAEIIRIFVEEP